MFDGLIYAAFYGFVLAFALGPVFFTLIETAITKGIRAALVFDLGALSADIIFILIAFYSTSRVLDKVKNDPGLLIFGGVILMVYGVISYIRTSKSFFRIAREHFAITTKKNFGSLFLKGFLLNFINFGVLIGWIGTLIMANALTSTDRGVFLFIVTVLITFFSIDLLKIILAKRLKSKMTPHFIFKTKKWVSILIIGFGIFLLFQGIFPTRMEAGLDRIPSKSVPIERPTSNMDDGI